MVGSLRPEARGASPLESGRSFRNLWLTGAAPSAQNVNERVLSPNTGLLNPQSRILGTLPVRVSQRRSSASTSVQQRILDAGSLRPVENIDDVVAPDPGLTPGVDNPLNIRLDKGRGNFDRVTRSR